jgi:hypothetical protein
MLCDGLSFGDSFAMQSHTQLQVDHTTNGKNTSTHSSHILARKATDKV